MHEGNEGSETKLSIFDKYNFSFVLSNPREPDCPIIYASDGFFETTGYHRSEIIGKNCRLLQGPGTSPQAIMEIRDAIREERSTSVCLLNFRKNKTPFWNAFTLAPIKDPNGVVLYYIGIQADVSNLISSEDGVNEEAVREIAAVKVAQALEIAKDVELHPFSLPQISACAASDASVPSSLVGALHAVAGAFVLTDPNLPDNPMVYCSPSFLKMTGYSRDEVIGKNFRIIQGPDTDFDVFTMGSPTTVTIVSYRKDGKPFTNCVHTAPIRDADGKVQFICGVQIQLGSEAKEQKHRASATPSEIQLEMPEKSKGEEPRQSEPTGLELLQQKGVVGAVRVAARALSSHGLRRSHEFQARPGEGC